MSTATIPASQSTVQSIGENERLLVLDAVRGFALLGVLIANLVLFAISNNVTTDTQQEAMFADPSNRAVLFVVLWLIDDKASDVVRLKSQFANLRKPKKSTETKGVCFQANRAMVSVRTSPLWRPNFQLWL